MIMRSYVYIGKFLWQERDLKHGVCSANQWHGMWKSIFGWNQYVAEMSTNRQENPFRLKIEKHDYFISNF